MLIGIDGNEANVSSRVGISEYAYQLLTRFAQYQVTDNKYQIYLKNDPLSVLPQKSRHWKYRVLKPGKLWTQWRLPLDLYMTQPRPEVFFSPTHYAPRFSPVPTVVSIMDLSYLYFPELFNSSDLYQLRNWTAYSVKNAARVLTISNSSKNDIMKEYNVPAEKVVTIYPGIKQIVTLQEHVYGMKELQAKYNIGPHFVLFVGTLQPRKNIARLIEAFSRTVKKAAHNKDQQSMHDLQLLVVGKRGWLYEDILAAPEKFGVTEKVKFLEGVTDEELEVLYKHAQCYVLPSLYEGFGLPVLEAMKYNCPVITSNISSLPEAGGDAALYVDPKDVNDISDKITKLLGDAKLRQTLREKGEKQVAKFSWDKTARETLRVLEEVAKK